MDRAGLVTRRIVTTVNRGTMGFVRNSVGTKGDPMVGVVEWTAPVRNSAWVAACFGSVDR
jgi:hypothetical protein